jgi:predicted HTH domain antitoxin
MAALTLELPHDITPDEARLMLALRLLEEHRISLGKGAEISGYSKVAFIEIAAKHGVAVLDYPPGDLQREMALRRGSPAAPPITLERMVSRSFRRPLTKPRPPQPRVQRRVNDVDR